MPTVSIVKGRGYLNHNDRTIKQVNSRSWEPELSSQNIVYVNEPIQNVYHELFDLALEVYNQNLVEKYHSDRQIKDYYEHISRSKQEKPFYEYIVAFGNINDKNTEIYPVLQQCLDEYNRGFQSRNPNFRVIQQITHRDEAGIDHTHIDIVPVCSGNTRGLETKNSFTGALKEMGYTGKKAFLDWRRSEEKVMSEILESHGLEFERGDGRKEHLNVRQYKEYKKYEELTIQEMQHLETLQKKSTEIHQDLDQLNASKQNLLKEIDLLEVRKSNLEKTLLFNSLEKIQKVDKFVSEESELIGREIMNIKFADGIDIVIKNTHIQNWSGVKSADNNLYLLSMDDGMYYLFDLNNKIIREYDDFSKLPDILMNEI